MRRPAPVRRPWLGKSAALALAALAALGAWWWVRAEAQVREQMLGLGAHLVTLSPGAGPRTIHLNDQQLRFALGSTGASVGDVIARARAECHTRPLDLATWARGETQPAQSDGSTLAWSDEAHGFVGCVGDGEAGVERLRQSGDLADAGGLRYLYAERRGASTLVAAVESVGSFELARVMPAEGDASGHDLRGIPRPPGARRLLSVEIDGEPERARFYQGALDPDAVRAHYRRVLPSMGWRVLTRDDARTVQAEGPRGFVVISPQPGREGTTTVVLHSDERRSLGTPPGAPP